MVGTRQEMVKLLLFRGNLGGIKEIGVRQFSSLEPSTHIIVFLPEISPSLQMFLIQASGNFEPDFIRIQITGKAAKGGENEWFLEKYQ